MDSGPAQLAGGRFAQPEDERAYRAWKRQQALPYAKTGYYLSAFGWLSLVLVSAWAAPERFPKVAAVVLGPLAPAFLAMGLTHRPRFQRWILAATAFANTIAGLVVVTLAFGVLDLPELSSAGVILIGFFGFAVFRLEPWQAGLGVAIYTAAHLLLLARYGHFGPLATTVHAYLPLLSYAIGSVVCVVIDRLSRDAWRKTRVIEAQQRALEHERDRADQLLHSILPPPIAERLKRERATIADRFDEVTVLFADVVGFTPLAARLTPERVVTLLNELFTRFDELAGRFGVEKIKTIGDAYMAVAGLPEPRPDHARVAADLALAMREALQEVEAKTDEGALRLRIGLASGPVVAGVIGARKFAYDLWGDTVNTAARMESQGLAGEIQLAESTAKALGPQYRLEERGVIEVKGKGPMKVWLLAGRAAVASGSG